MLQCIPLGSPGVQRALQTASESFASNLAKNAFNGAVFCNVFLALLMGISERFARVELQQADKGRDCEHQRSRRPGSPAQSAAPAAETASLCHGDLPDSKLAHDDLDILVSLRRLG